jgi:hypothetical protein
MTDTSIVVLQLSSGTTVISSIEKKTETELVLNYPLEMNFSFDDEDNTRLYLNRFMPYSSDDLVTVRLATIEGQAVCSAKYLELYKTRVEQFKKVAKQVQFTNSEDLNEDDSDEQDDTPMESSEPVRKFLH